MINVKNLNFNYKKGLPLFTDLSIKLEPGCIYGLLGKNGAGKTTLLKIMSGMLYPQKGECTLNGVNTFKRKPKTFEEIFFIPEEFELPKLNIEKFASIHASFYPNFSIEQFHEYLNDFKVESNQKIKDLSFGQKKMLLICFGLATNAKYLILDEPTNALDIPSKAIFRRLLTKAINSERSFIISTHQIRDLESIIDPIVILDAGKIVFNKSCDEIMKGYRFEQSSELNNEGLIYSEEKLGSYSSVRLNNQEDITNINLELLFNAITNKTTAELSTQKI